MCSSDFDWLVEHSDEIVSQYAGKWIAVRDGEVIGVGNTATEAAAQARKKVSDADFVLEGVDAAPLLLQDTSSEPNRIA